MTGSIDIVAFYLPQFHPVPLNDEWWGPGFSEWTNTAAARPLFRGHAQPNLPGELGFYDLRCDETRSDQAELATSHGISAFAYWHYWFDGRLLLEQPLERVLKEKRPSLPFCIAWANHSWSTGTWNATAGSDSTAVLHQTYPGVDDHVRHFEYLLPFFRDERYYRIDGRCVVYIREPSLIPDLQQLAALWRRMASNANLGGLHFVGEVWEDLPRPQHVDSVARFHRPTTMPARQNVVSRAGRRLLGRPILRRWEDLRRVALRIANNEWPVIMPNWDTTPRRGRSGTVLQGTSPAAFEDLLDAAITRAASLPDPQVIFIKSWNEWAEGNYLEPDRTWGRGWLEAVRNARRRQASTS